MFFQKAFEGDNDGWRWVLTAVLALCGYFIGQFPLAAAMFYYAYKNNLMTELGQEELMDVMARADFATLGMDLNVALFCALLMFVGMALALGLFLKTFHRRRWKSLINPIERIQWGKIFFSFFLWLAFTMVLEAVSYFSDADEYTFTFDLWKFIPLLAIVLFLMPIQTSVEELFFRGYLLQGFGRWTKSKLWGAIITSLLFSGMHMMNPEVAKFGWGIMFTYYFSVGFFLALITIMDDSLELALGIHAATNMFSALFVSYEGGAIQTNAVFRVETVDVTMMLPIFYVVASIYFAICWWRYNWDWQTFTERVLPPANSSGEQEEISGI